jgi:hypothetical protein
MRSCPTRQRGNCPRGQLSELPHEPAKVRPLISRLLRIRGAEPGRASNRLRTVVFQAGLKAGFCPALASSGPVCPGIALLLAHCLAARTLPPACGLGDGAKPPENRQSLPIDALHQLCQDGAAMNEGENQFSFTRAAPSTSGAAKSKFLSVTPEFAQSLEELIRLAKQDRIVLMCAEAVP